MFEMAERQCGANRVHIGAQTIYRLVIEGLFRLKNNWGDSLAILALRE